MASSFKKGDPVRQIVVPLSGTVAGFQVDQETGDRLVKVEWTDAAGDQHARFFKEDEIEAAPL